jgi:succinyl-diaminopimelate desuccinylase
MSTDPVELTAALVRCPSVTPEEGGALQLLENADGGRLRLHPGRSQRHAEPLRALGATERAAGPRVQRPYRCRARGRPRRLDAPPFSAQREDGWLYGRGATDMKSGVAAFVAAAIDLVAEAPPDGAIVIAITGDEEGPGRDGTIAILDWMAETGEHMDVCIVGEPTSRTDIGDMIKIGRRGSMTAHGSRSSASRAIRPTCTRR